MEDELARRLSKGSGDLEEEGTVHMELRGRSLGNVWTAWLSVVFLESCRGKAIGVGSGLVSKDTG